MRRLIDRCAGIDVGQALLVVCVRVVNGTGEVVQEIRSFGATTPDLLELRDWLAASEVTHVAMESTGVYWKAPYYMLEDEFEVLLVNEVISTRSGPGGRDAPMTGEYRPGRGARGREFSSTSPTRRGPHVDRLSCHARRPP